MSLTRGEIKVAADLPGRFVLSGSITTAPFVHPGDFASATISGLGTVSLGFA